MQPTHPTPGHSRTGAEQVSRLLPGASGAKPGIETRATIMPGQ